MLGTQSDSIRVLTVGILKQNIPIETKINTIQIIAIGGNNMLGIQNLSHNNSTTHQCLSCLL